MQTYTNSPPLTPLTECESLASLDSQENQSHPRLSRRPAKSPAQLQDRVGRPEQKPSPTAKLAYLDPAFQQWVKATQALPAEKQIEAVSKKLMELNPGFDGKLTGSMEGPQDRERRGDGVGVSHGQRDRHFAGAGVVGIEYLTCAGSEPGKASCRTFHRCKG